MTSSWLQEPLLQFAVLGALIFAVDGLVSGGIEDSRVITIDRSLRADLAEKFVRSTNREPTPEELDQMIDGWVHQEVLYREGLALGLDRSDGFVRERVISLVQALTINNAKPGAPTEAELREHFERNKASYLRPRRYSFEHMLIRDSGPDSEAEADSLLHALAAGGEPQTLGRRVLSVRRRTGAEMSAIFGEGFAERLDSLPIGRWQKTRSQRGWHLLRLGAIDPELMPDFAAARREVEDAWRQETALREAAARYREMRAGYDVAEEDRDR